MKREHMKFLLDDNCRISKKRRRKDIQIDTVNERMGTDIEDPEIRGYATKEEYIVVTKDQDFIRESIRNKVPVALYYDGYAFVITAELIDLLDKQFRDAGKIPH